VQWKCNQNLCPFDFIQVERWLNAAGLAIINNCINPTQTHHTLQVAVDIWVLCLQLKKINLHLITSFHLAPSVPVNYFYWLHTKKNAKTEYDQ
jgi:hypothetical protein